MNRIYRIIVAIAAILFVLEGCEETVPAITPTGDLTFFVVDGSGNSVSNARVYLFQSRTSFDNYLSENPNADPGTTPTLNPENIGTTNSNGEVSFNAFELDGPFYASGNTNFYNPSPIYYRVEGSPNGSDYLTNDAGPNKLEFDELESGSSIQEEIDVVIE